MTELRDLLKADPIDMNALAEHLDALPGDERLLQVRSMSFKMEKRLYHAAQGFKAISIDDIVPPSVGVMQPVRHDGKNTIPIFSYFAKVFMRPTEDGPELWGYNATNWLITTFVGPGYFVAYNHSVPGEVLVDYLRLPEGGHPDWPAIIGNDKRLSRLVYYQTQDVLRGVSKHVSIGRATKKGKDMPAYFVLCRQD